MAMDGTQLGSEIYAEIIEGKLDADASDEVKAVWQKIASVIVSHIQTNAQVTVTVNTTGSATAQSGTGEGSIK